MAPPTATHGGIHRVRSAGCRRLSHGGPVIGLIVITALILPATWGSWERFDAADSAAHSRYVHARRDCEKAVPLRGLLLHSRGE